MIITHLKAVVILGQKTWSVRVFADIVFTYMEEFHTQILKLLQ